jgi:hypothetical protein
MSSSRQGIGKHPIWLANHLMHTDLHQAPAIVPAAPPGAPERGRSGARGQSRASPKGPFREHAVLPLLSDPDLLYPLSLVALALVVAGVLWRKRSRHLRQAARRRAAAYRLIDALKAYTAWIDWHRDEPLLHQNPADGGIPAPLAQAVQIKDEHFPELAALLLQLLQAHRELTQYLWEENILRMTHASSLRPHYADPRYHNIRDRQDATLDSLFMRCRELAGDAGLSDWQRTRSDFSFSTGGTGVPSHPSA